MFERRSSSVTVILIFMSIFMYYNNYYVRFRDRRHVGMHPDDAHQNRASNGVLPFLCRTQ